MDLLQSLVVRLHIDMIFDWFMLRFICKFQYRCMREILILLLFLILSVFILGCSQQQSQQQATTVRTEPTTTTTSVPSLKYCMSDSDCACGVYVGTKECFYGNKYYVDTNKQCPDFCSGIGGNLAIRCVNNECKQVPRYPAISKTTTTLL